MNYPYSNWELLALICYIQINLFKKNLSDWCKKSRSTYFSTALCRSVSSLVDFSFDTRQRLFKFQPASAWLCHTYLAWAIIPVSRAFRPTIILDIATGFWCFKSSRTFKNRRFSRIFHGQHTPPSVTLLLTAPSLRSIWQ